MEKKEYVTPSMRWKDIETSELLQASKLQDTKNPPTEEGEFDSNSKQNFGNNAWDNE